MLEVTDVVELQFGLVERQPVEAGGRLQIQRRNTGFHLGAAEFVILANFGFAVRLANLQLLLGRPRARANKLRVLPVFRPRMEARLIRVKVEMRVKRRRVRRRARTVRILLRFLKRLGAQFNRFALHRE